MPPMQFKFKFARDDDVHIANYQDNPSWDDLASRVSRIYKIPPADVGISYNDSEGDEITISSDEELRDYYTTLPQIQHHSLKFIVKDLRPKRPPRPATDIFASLDEAWTPPLFTTVPLTPNRLYQQGGTGAHIEELDEVDEQKSTGNYDDDDDLKSYLDIPGQQQAPEDADDASSIDSVLDDDLPDKKPIHVYRFSTHESRRARSAASLSRSSTRSKSVAESVDQTRQNLEAQFDIVNSEQFKMQSPKPSEFDIVDDAFPAAGNHLPDPTDSHTRNQSRSRSPLLHPHTIPSREPSVDRYSARSSRVASEYPSPIIVIPTIDTASPRGAPASVDIRSIPSPDPIVISVPSIPEESMLLQETSAMTITEPDPPLPTLPPFSFSSATAATTTTTPSLTNDIATLLDALIGAFNEHPELSEGLRNIVSNASQGVYWNNATEAIRSIRDTVVSDALQARDVIRTESATATRDVSSQVQAEAGRRIAEALGNVFRSLGTVLVANSSAGSTEAAPVSAAPSVPQSQAQRQQHQVHSSRRSQTSLGAPRAESPLLIKATPLIHSQDIPPDARSLSRPSSRSSSSERDNNLYPGGSTVRVSRRGEKYGYAPPQFIPVVWAPPPPRAPRDGRGPYGPPPPPVVIPTPMHSHGYGRSRHHRSQSGTTGSGARYPPPAGPPPPGAYYMPPYPSSPYSYRPDPRMYMDQYYNRNGYPGIGAGANMRRSNTLPPSFPVNAEQPPPVSEAARPIITAPEIPRPVQPSSPSASLANARNAPVGSTVTAARSPTPSFGASPSIAATTTEIPGSSAALVTTSGTLQKSLDDTYIELEEVKRLYKEKKEDYRREREERKVQKERERAQRHAEREAKRQARLAAVARVRGQPIVTPQPAAPVATLKQHTSGDVSGSESGTEKALPIPFERGPITSTPPRRANSSTERLNKEVHDRLNAMGFTTRSYPQLNTLVPMNIRKHVMMLPDVPDDVIIHNVLEDIFGAPTLPTSSSNKI